VAQAVPPECSPTKPSRSGPQHGSSAPRRPTTPRKPVRHSRVAATRFRRADQQGDPARRGPCPPSRRPIYPRAGIRGCWGRHVARGRSSRRAVPKSTSGPDQPYRRCGRTVRRRRSPSHVNGRPPDPSRFSFFSLRRAGSSFVWPDLSVESSGPRGVDVVDSWGPEGQGDRIPDDASWLKGTCEVALEVDDFLCAHREYVVLASSIPVRMMSSTRRLFSGASAVRSQLEATKASWGVPSGMAAEEAVRHAAGVDR
jgi:hypothetical protein